MKKSRITAETKDNIIRDSSLTENNRLVKEELQKQSMDYMIESTKSAFGGIDLTDEKVFDFDHPFFSWKKFRENTYNWTKGTYMEANADNTLGALLRNGINMQVNNWYNLVDTNHESIGMTTYSTHAIELYAPLQRAGVPRRVSKGAQFPRTRVVGRDIQIANEKFGAIFDFEAELFEDDQTGQINQRARDIGLNMAILEDAWFFQRFIASAGSYAGDAIPASVTYGANVWVNALSGGGSNRPASYLAFSSANLQSADLALMNQLDLQGNKVLVNPNTLLVGTSNKFTARTLLNSQWYPTNTDIKIGGASGTASTIGTTFAENEMKGLYNLVISRFMPQKAWSIGEAGKGIVFQRRSATEVIQENPMSGMAFSNDVYQYRTRARWEPDWIELYFWYLGNDGTV